MGYVTCGRHGSRCCWRCDKCPKCSGEFKRVGRGDYCPDCTRKLKAEGYVWSEFRKDFVQSETLAAESWDMSLAVDKDAEYLPKKSA